MKTRTIGELAALYGRLTARENFRGTESRNRRAVKAKSAIRELMFGLDKSAWSAFSAMHLARLNEEMDLLRLGIDRLNERLDRADARIGSIEKEPG